METRPSIGGLLACRLSQRRRDFKDALTGFRIDVFVGEDCQTLLALALLGGSLTLR